LARAKRVDQARAATEEEIFYGRPMPLEKMPNHERTFWLDGLQVQNCVCAPRLFEGFGKH
jgi:hypothetical protein